MRIQDAKPGDVLRDKAAAVWLVGKTSARCIYEPMLDGDGDCAACGASPVRLDAAEHFGPFTRLVPEKETP